MEQPKTRALALLCVCAVTLVAAYTFSHLYWTALTLALLAAISCAYAVVGHSVDAAQANMNRLATALGKQQLQHIKSYSAQFRPILAAAHARQKHCVEIIYRRQSRSLNLERLRAALAVNLWVWAKQKFFNTRRYTYEY